MIRKITAMTAAMLLLVFATWLLAGTANAQGTCETPPDPAEGWSMGYIVGTYSENPGYYIERKGGETGLTKRGPIEAPSGFRIRLVDGVGADPDTGKSWAYRHPRLEFHTGAVTDPRAGAVASLLSHKAFLLTDGEAGPETLMYPYYTASLPLPVEDGKVMADTIGVRVCLNGEDKNCTDWTFETPHAALEAAADAFDPACTTE